MLFFLANMSHKCDYRRLILIVGNETWEDYMKVLTEVNQQKVINLLIRNQ